MLMGTIIIKGVLMRATTQRGLLLETLGKVKPAVGAKSALPVCASILIRAGGGRLALVATNLEVALTASCKATIGRQGAVAIPASLLEGFLRASKADKIVLSLASPSSLAIEGGGATTVLRGFEAKDFPPIPGVSGLPTVVTGLANALKEVSYAMAKEDSRPVLAGVSFTLKDGKMELAAADGFRLALTTVKARGTLGQVIVPSKAICLIQKLMPGKVSIHKGGDKLAFIGEGLVLTTHAVQGSFPNYENIIPKNGQPVTADSQGLRDALDAVSVTLNDAGIVRLEKKGTKLVVSTENEELGKTEVKLPAKGHGKIAFSALYLKELLARIEGRISLRITDVATPGVVKQGRTLHVLMPMFVQW